MNSRRRALSARVFNKARLALAALAALALLSCRAAEPAHPALWRVDGPGGQTAWLFGTIHALPAPVAWRSAAVEKALAAADRVVVEAADLEDRAKAADLFQRLGTSAGLAPLSQRVAPNQRPELNRLLAKAGLNERQFDGTETWAAALTLNQVSLAEARSEGENGIDRQILLDHGGKPLDQFEGLEGQLSLFDHLSEDDQRALLSGVIASAPQARQETERLQAAWKGGDVQAIAALDGQGMLADPDLRRILLVARNQAWIVRLKGLMGSGAKPFVAVGALHLVGPDGLVAQFEAQGYRVRRLQ